MSLTGAELLYIAGTVMTAYVLGYAVGSLKAIFTKAVNNS